VPEEYKTAEICLATIKRNGGALKHVPMELRTLELCLEAVKDSAHKYGPDDVRSRNKLLTLGHVPEHLKAQVEAAL